LTCTAFTAFLDVSTNPLVIVPNKPDCEVAEVPSGLSSAAGDFGDKRSPNPLVKRAKVDFPALPVGESSGEEVNGWGIFKLLAHDVMPAAESFDGASLAGFSGTGSAAAAAAGGGGCVSGALTDGGGVSADSESILVLKCLDNY
jgi:hypothetical protein